MSKTIITKQLHISGMTCGGCERKIEKKLIGKDGIEEVKASYVHSMVTITFDERIIKLKVIEQFIEEMGYSPVEEQNSTVAITFDERITKLNKIEQFIEEMGYSPVEKQNSTVTVTSDERIMKLKKIEQFIEEMGYSPVEKQKSNTKQQEEDVPDIKKIAYIGMIVFGAYIFIKEFFGFDIFNSFPVAQEGMSYVAIFFIGLLTSVHCIAMCGGISLSQCVSNRMNNDDHKLASLKPSFLYNVGRVTGYTMVGGIIGAIGSVITLSGAAKGAVAIFAGIFMIIMGLNMLNIFPWLRRLNFTMPRFFTRSLEGLNHSESPFYVGLFNSLMPCGPLQAMQLYALSTGNPLKGALAMFLFSVGTVPLMFGFGAVSSFLSKKFASKMMTVSAVLVIILGISMFNNGMGLSGFSGISLGSNTSEAEMGTVEIVDGVQQIETQLGSREYPEITVQKDMPVRWVINADSRSINGCNNILIIPEFEYALRLAPGENIIEFTPEESGTIPYSCWMGMIRSQITVVE